MTLDGTTDVDENIGRGVTIMGDDDVTDDVVFDMEERSPRWFCIADHWEKREGEDIGFLP